MKSETALGKLWAAKMRSKGVLVQKMPSSGRAGVADWLVCAPGSHIRFVEAKRRNGKAVAYRPEQLTRAQRFFLDWVVRGEGVASVLILDDDGFVEIDWQDARKGAMSGRAFDAVKEPYE